jgi:hypothetical protein
MQNRKQAARPAAVDRLAAATAIIGSAPPPRQGDFIRLKSGIWPIGQAASEG